jgi:hypothetical protein
MIFGIRRKFSASDHRKKDAPFKKPRKSTITLEKKHTKGGFFHPNKILNAILQDHFAQVFDNERYDLFSGGMIILQARYFLLPTAHMPRWPSTQNG